MPNSALLFGEIASWHMKTGWDYSFDGTPHFHIMFFKNPITLYVMWHATPWQEVSTKRAPERRSQMAGRREAYGLGNLAERKPYQHTQVRRETGKWDHTKHKCGMRWQGCKKGGDVWPIRRVRSIDGQIGSMPMFPQLYVPTFPRFLFQN